MLSKKGAPLSPPAWITFFIFLGGGWRGGLGGKGGNTFCVPAFLVASRTRGIFILPFHYLELEELAACNKISHTTATRNVYWSFNFCGWRESCPSSTIGPRAETGRTQSGTLQRNEVKLMRAATGLTVLALKRALLTCAATCEPAGKCKQCVNEWSAMKWSWMREHSVCYLFWKMALLEPGEM